MLYLKNRKKRLFVSLLAGMIAVMFVTPFWGIRGKPGIMAWWGTLYPEFCFAKIEDPEDSLAEDACGHRVKISFWLAQVLDW